MTEVLGVVTRVVVAFNAEIMLFLAVVSCGLVVAVVRGASNIVVLLLAVNSPVNTADRGVDCVTTGVPVILSSFFVAVNSNASGFSVGCPKVDLSAAVGSIPPGVTVCAGGRYWACPLPYVA